MRPSSMGSSVRGCSNTSESPTRGSRPLLDYIILRPGRDTALARAQARTDIAALVDRASILQMWDEFAHLKGFEHHVLDSTDEAADITADRVAEAIASGRFRLPM